MVAYRMMAYKMIVEYIRYSSHNQDDGFSIEYQQSEIKDCAERKGLAIDESYIDAARTGTKVAGREQFYNLIKAVKNDKIEAIIVYKMSRMFRNAQESQYYRDLFRSKGVRIISVTEHIDEESTSGRMTTNILSVIDQYQSEIISDHVKSSMREMARQGYYTGGEVIYGYELKEIQHGKKVRKKFIPNDEEAEIVNLIFEMYANGKSLPDIRRYLMAKNIMNRKGKPFTTDFMRQMLRRDSYIGRLRFQAKGYEEVVVEDARPAIVSSTVWNAVQSRLKEIKPIGKLKKRIYALTGKIYCSCGSHYCGTTATITRKDRTYEYANYICADKKKYRLCKVSQVNKEYIENAVMRAIKENILNPSVIDDIALKTFAKYKGLPESVNAEIKQLRSDIANLNNRIDILIEMRQNGELSGEVIKQRSAPLEDKLFKSQKRLAVLMEQKSSEISLEKIKAYLNDMLTKSASKEPEIMKELFNNFVERITISQDDIDINLRITPYINKNSNVPKIELSATVSR